MRAGRIPLLSPTPHVPQGYPPKAFAGEVVPFGVVSFREGHDRIGVHVRLRDPSGDETLHVVATRTFLVDVHVLGGRE